MKKYKWLLLLLLLLCFSPILSEAQELNTTEYSENLEVQEFTPEPFIIDTDFSSDIDDALAISVACGYEHQGLINIRGVALCCTSSRGAHAMSALLGRHKIWDVPIACSADTGIPIGSKYHMGMTAYPHNETYFGDVVNFYRIMLASSPEKVNIVVLGQIVNLYELLNSVPDVHSQLNGYELIKEKVDTIYFLGGKSNGCIENNIFYGGDNYGNNPYWNNTKISEITKYVAENIPCRMVWMEADITGSFSVGGFLEKTDKKKEDILTRALVNFGQPWGSASFDPFGVYIAALDSNDILTENMLELQSGTMRVKLTGTSYFTHDDSTRNHFRVEKLANDGFYQSEINKILASEYTLRSGKEIIW